MFFFQLSATAMVEVDLFTQLLTSNAEPGDIRHKNCHYLPLFARHYSRLFATIRTIHCSVFSVFTSHVIKSKNRNQSINKVKNLEYDR